MLLLFSLLPATILVVVGYFVLFASTRSQQGMKRFGQYLGAWILLLAGVTVLGGLLGSTVGLPGPMGRIGQGIERMEEHMETMENLQKEQLRERQPK